MLCMLCLCFAGTSRLALFMLPMLNRIRFLLFVTLFNFLVTGAILFLDVTHTVYLFPFNWGKLVSMAVHMAHSKIIYIAKLSYLIHYLERTILCHDDHTVSHKFFTSSSSGLFISRVLYMGTSCNTPSITRGCSKLNKI